MSHGRTARRCGPVAEVVGPHRKPAHPPPPVSAPRKPPPLFTVLIPTYNRAHLVTRALNSVAAQEFSDFEIVVVDDGSSDGTLGEVRRWSQRTGLPVTSIWKPNGGAHSAYNLGVRQARGEYIVVLGSDDQLLPDALRKMADAWASIPAAKKQAYCAVLGHGLHWSSRRLAGDPYPHDVWDSDFLQMKQRWGISGDKPGAYRRDLLMRHPFPVFEGERFMRESFVIKQLAQRYRTRFVNESFQLFEYQRDGLSASVRRLRVSSPRGMALCYRDEANRHTVGFSPGQRFEAHLQYVRHACNAGIGLRAQCGQIESRTWLLLALPFGLVKHWRDRLADAPQRQALGGRRAD
ncbi:MULTISPECIES: glycosyltransferase family 2 protein [Hydrocarboniphaga]|uniref:glycosyltransferase family 2 protein n=1 Tax=Hydrocarboniphaga TaxID=243627 RepID=UPI000A0180DF|nr:MULTISPECIES: glycosyltransferase family 2 protein [Hydrocarboniphaga]MDZ4078812.1 glycosyltransferase family 2 protein [Hydrocarboniphaga sp.]